jgi:hypothetical protein
MTMRHFSPPTIDAAAAHGVPLPGLIVPLSGIIALLGGLSVLLGFQTRLRAALLVISYFGAGPLSLDALLFTKEQSRHITRDQAAAPRLKAMRG